MQIARPSRRVVSAADEADLPVGHERMESRSWFCEGMCGRVYVSADIDVVVGGKVDVEVMYPEWYRDR